MVEAVANPSVIAISTYAYPWALIGIPLMYLTSLGHHFILTKRHVTSC